MSVITISAGCGVEGGQALRAGEGGRHLVAVRRERAREDPQEVGFVVDDQQSCHASRQSYQWGGREAQAEGRPTARCALDVDGSAVILDDAVADAGAQAGALAHFLGGEKRLEELALDMLGHAVARVDDLDDDAAAVGARADGDAPVARDRRAPARALFVDRVDGVADQVHEDLLQPVVIRQDRRQVGGEIELDLDLVHLELVAEDLEHVADGVVQVQTGCARTPPAGRMRARA